MARSVIALTFIAASPVVVHPRHPLATDDHGTVGRGKVEVELASESLWSSQTEEGQTAILSAVHLGVASRLDLGLGLAHPLGADAEPNFIWGNPTFDAKRLLGAAGQRPGLAI